MKLRISLLAVAAILMSAHFLRYSEMIPMVICLATPFALLIKKRWSLRMVQALTVVAAAIWLVTLKGIIQARMLEGRSWTVAAIILGVVTAYTLLTGWLLNSPAVKDRYPKKAD